jgi:hypothetical protein
MEFAGEALGKLLWDPAALPGADLMAEFAALSGLSMSQRMQELMRLRSDRIARLSSAELRTLMDGRQGL